MNPSRARTWSSALLAAAAVAATLVPPPARAAGTPGQPLQPPGQVRLVPEWAVGGEDSEVFFGMVVAAAADAAGDLYVLDSQLARVEVFSPAGDHLRTVVQRGEGPGEARAPTDLCLLDDGTVVVLDRFPARLVRVRGDGTPVSTVELEPARAPGSGRLAGFAVAGCGDAVVVAGGHNADQMQRSVKLLARFGLDGRELGRLREASTPIDRAHPALTDREFLDPFSGAWAVGPGGCVYFPADPDRYVIAALGPGGDVVREVSREYRPRPRTGRELRRLAALIDAHLAGLRDRTRVTIDTVEPAVAALQCDDRGVLWVEHGHSRHDLPPGVLLRLDTFDAEGRWLREVHLLADGDPEFDRVLLLGDGRALLVRNGQLARWADHAWHPVSVGEDGPAGPLAIVSCRLQEVPDAP